MKTPAYTRQIDGIRRDSIRPQYLHALPFPKPKQERCNPLAVLCIYMGSGFVAFGTIALIWNLCH